jgi:hypothetical protein
MKLKVERTRVPFDNWNTPNILYWIEKVPNEIKTEDIPLILGGVKRLDDVTTHLGINVDFKKLANENYMNKMFKEQKAMLNKENYEWFESDFLSAYKEAVLLEQKDVKTLIKKILHHQGLTVFSFNEQRDFMKKGLDYPD